MRLLLSFLLFISVGASAQQPDSVHQLIDSALRVMEHRSINSRSINWPQLRDSVYQLSAGAQTDREAFTALAYAFDRLNDKHGWLTINDSAHFNRKIARAQSPLSEGLKAGLSRGAHLFNGIIDTQYAYLNIPFFMGQDEKSMNAFAQAIQDSLCKNIKPGTKGIIIDLRCNGGGNCYPMYQGLANVYGNRVLTRGVNGRRQQTGSFAINKGTVVLHGNHNDSIVLHLDRTCGDLTQLPVAVLIGPATGSSAEQLAIAFTSRPNTILIGEQTAGYVTANNGFELPGTKNSIVVAEGLSRNAKGQLFAEYVQPEIKVINGDDFFNLERDAKIKAAVQWLKKRSKESKQRQ